MLTAHSPGYYSLVSSDSLALSARSFNCEVSLLYASPGGGLIVRRTRSLTEVRIARRVTGRLYLNQECDRESFREWLAEPARRVWWRSRRLAEGTTEKTDCGVANKPSIGILNSLDQGNMPRRGSLLRDGWRRTYNVTTLRGEKSTMCGSLWRVAEVFSLTDACNFTPACSKQTQLPVMHPTGTCHSRKYQDYTNE